MLFAWIIHKPAHNSHCMSMPSLVYTKDYQLQIHMVYLTSNACLHLLLHPAF